MENTVTIRIDKLTKVALDFFAAKLYAERGRSVTNNDAIFIALTIADPDSVRLAMEASAHKNVDNEDSDD